MNKIKSFNLTKREAQKLLVASEIARKILHQIDAKNFALCSTGIILNKTDLYMSLVTLGEIGDAQKDGKVEYTIGG